jgi:type IV fimbrial biogenesis protein FimT
MRRQFGFTLIELMVTVAILVILVTVALPSFQSVITSNRLADARGSMLSAIQYTKGEAVARNRAVSLCSSIDGATCAGANDWGAGWIVVTDNNATGTTVSIGELLRVFQAPDAAHVTVTHGGASGAIPHLRFLPTGIADSLNEQKYFGFCDPSGNGQARSLIVSVTTGALSTGTEANANCP